MKREATEHVTANRSVMGTAVQATSLLVLLTLCQIGQLADAQALCCQSVCSDATDQFACLSLEPAKECPPQNCTCVWSNTTQVTVAGTEYVALCDAEGVVRLDDGGGELGFGWALLIGFGVCFCCIGVCCVAWLLRTRKNKRAQGSGVWQTRGSKPGSFRDRPSSNPKRQVITEPILSPAELEEARMEPAMSPEEATEVSGYAPPSLSRQLSRVSSRAGSVRNMRTSEEIHSIAGSRLSRTSSAAGSRAGSHVGSHVGSRTGSRARGSARRRLKEETLSAASPAAMEREASGEISISVRTPRSDYDGQGLARSPSGVSSAGRSVRSQGSMRSLTRSESAYSHVSESARSHNSSRRTRSARSGEGGFGGSFKGASSVRSGESGFGGSSKGSASMRSAEFGGSFKGPARPSRARSVASSNFSSSTGRLSQYTQNSGMTRHYDDIPSTAFDSKRLGDDAFAEPLFKPAVADYGLKKPEPTTFTRIPKNSDSVQKVGEGMTSPRSSLKKTPSEGEKRKKKKKGEVRIETRKRASLLFGQLEAEAHSSELFSKYPTAPITEESKEEGSASLRNSSSTAMQGVGSQGPGWNLAQGSFTNGGQGKKPPPLDLSKATGVVEAQVGFMSQSEEGITDDGGSFTDIKGVPSDNDETTTELTSAMTSHRHSQEEMEFDGMGGGVDEEHGTTPSALRARARLHSDHVSVLGSEEGTPAMSRNVSRELGNLRRQVSREAEGASSPMVAGQLARQVSAKAREIDKGSTEMEDFVSEISREVGQAQADGAKERGERRKPRSPVASSPQPRKSPSPEVHGYHRVSVVAEECTVEGFTEAEHEETIKEEEDMQTPREKGGAKSAQNGTSPEGQAKKNENIIEGEDWGGVSLAGGWN